MKQKSNAKKWFGITALVIVALVVVVVVCVLNRLDMLVKAGLEKYGSLATGTSVKVESVNIHLREGSGSIQGLTVANIKGFESAKVFSMGEVGIRVDIRSLTKDVKIIDEILVRGPEIFADVRSDGTINLKVIKNNLDKFTPAKKPETSESVKAGPAIKMIIKRIYFTEGVIHARIALKGGETFQLKLPTIELTGLGEKNGATPEQLSKEIIGELCGRALAEVQKKVGNLVVDKARDKAKSMLEDAARKTGGNVGGF